MKTFITIAGIVILAAMLALTPVKVEFTDTELSTGRQVKYRGTTAALGANEWNMTRDDGVGCLAEEIRGIVIISCPGSEPVQTRKHGKGW